MTPFTRRDFLGTSAAAVGTLAAGSLLVEAAETKNKPKSAGDLVTLGKTGIKTSLLGMGTGSVGVKRSSNQVKLGQEKFTKLVRHAYDKGLRYFDVADQYGSHIFLREAIRKLPRENLYIQTKTRALSAEVAKADIDRFLEELGVEYIDTVLMHCMTRGSWPKEMKAVMDVLSGYKDKKKIRAVGVSCHGMAPLKAAVDCDWVEIDLARINPIGGDKGRMDGTPDEVSACLKKMHKKGKGVVGMKILAEGTLKKPEEQLKSLKYVLGLGCVDCFCIGFETPQQIDGICKLIETALKA
jgi:predicted aldo/keto reductase-like oxidoreductase